MKIDYHIHSTFSADSCLDMKALIKKGVKMGYSEIAFTDHFDLLPSEIAIYGTPSYVGYSESIDALRSKYSLSILKGVELGEYHLSHKLADEVLSYSEAPDLKIASIHVLPDGTNVSEATPAEITKDLIESYYLENLALVSYGNFHILGHLGIYKRYLSEVPDESFLAEIIESIFKLLIEKRIALEVNLSGLRNPCNELIPSKKFLKMYQQLGGELITIGSDAHRTEDFDSNYDKAICILIECGFSNTARKTPKGWDIVSFSA